MQKIMQMPCMQFFLELFYTCFARFQKNTTTLMLFKRQLEHKVTII